MTTDSTHRSVRLERIENSKYVVTNDRGGQISMGKGEGTDFTPVDLLLAGGFISCASGIARWRRRRLRPSKGPG
jgi:putative redox protein